MNFRPGCGTQQDPSSNKKRETLRKEKKIEKEKKERERKWEGARKVKAERHKGGEKEGERKGGRHLTLCRLPQINAVSPALS